MVTYGYLYFSKTIVLCTSLFCGAGNLPISTFQISTCNYEYMPPFFCWVGSVVKKLAQLKRFLILDTYMKDIGSTWHLYIYSVSSFNMCAIGK